MSVVHAFFTQRRKELASGQVSSDADTVRTALRKGIVSSAQATSSHAHGQTVGTTKRCFHIAVQGCCHGELDRVYEACAYHENQTGKKIDLLICCGDFQAIRNYADLASMAVPDKYKVTGSFPVYYAPVMNQGAREREAEASNEASKASSKNSETELPARATAPYLTLFVGGNHENSDWLAEESYGGFLAPNIFYMGHSGVVVIDGVLRIAGLSGIYKSADYEQPYPNRPYAVSNRDKRSAYHVRRIEVEKLYAYVALQKQTQTAPFVDIFLSHDWPVGITKYGNEEQLLRYKPYFRDDIAHKALGNPYTLALLQAIQPRFWFAAHLHCRFEAIVVHSNHSDRDSCPSATATILCNDDSNTTSRKGTGEIKNDPDTMGKSALAGTTTRFLALDKCGHNTHSFLDFIDVDVQHEAEGSVLGKSNNAESAAQCGPTVLSPQTQKPSPPVCAGADRVCRDAKWVRVLQASHAFVAKNRVNDAAHRHNCIRDTEGGSMRREDSSTKDGRASDAALANEGFDAQRACADILSCIRQVPLTVAETTTAARPVAPHEKKTSCDVMHTSVLFAPTTDSLLDALGLSHATPLQKRYSAQHSPTPDFAPSAPCASLGQHALGTSASRSKYTQQHSASNSSSKRVEEASGVELPPLSWSVDLGLS